MKVEFSFSHDLSYLQLQNIIRKEWREKLWRPIEEDKLMMEISCKT